MEIKHLNKKPSKEKLKTIGLIILGIVIIGYVGKVSFDKYRVKEEVRVRTEALETLIVGIKNDCRVLTLTASSSVKLMNMEDNCIKARQEAYDQANGKVAPKVPEPIVEIVELDEEEEN